MPRINPFEHGIAPEDIEIKTVIQRRVGEALQSVSEPEEEDDRERPTDTVNVVITDVGDRIIQAIKMVRQTKSLGLREAKDVVDRVRGGEPQVLLEGITRQEAEDLQDQFEAATLGIEIKRTDK